MDVPLLDFARVIIMSSCRGWSRRDVVVSLPNGEPITREVISFMADRSNESGLRRLPGIGEGDRTAFYAASPSLHQIDFDDSCVNAQLFGRSGAVRRLTHSLQLTQGLIDEF
jgi:hypothetical protein